MLADVSGERFVALDVHKHYVVVGAVNATQQVVLSPRRVDLDDLPSWSQQHLCSTGAVVLEATTNAWHLCDQFHPLVSSVTVAHPNLVKLITTARVKTDARNTLHLARLLAAGLIPAVWIPPQDVRELRGIVAHHARLIRQRTQAKNRLRSTLHRYNIVPPSAGLFTLAQRSWWEQLSLSAVEKLRIRLHVSQCSDSRFNCIASTISNSFNRDHCSCGLFPCIYLRPTSAFMDNDRHSVVFRQHECLFGPHVN